MKVPCFDAAIQRHRSWLHGWLGSGARLNKLAGMRAKQIIAALEENQFEILSRLGRAE